MALSDILYELEACGYRTRTFLVPACAIGARHRRYRVAIVGYSNGTRLQTKRPEQQTTRLTGTGEVVADSKSQLEGRLSFGTEQEKPRFVGGGKYVCDTTSERLSDGSNKPMGGQGTQEQEPERSMRRSAESRLGRMVNGISDWMDGDLDFLINHYWDEEPDIPRIATGVEHRVDRLKCLGNAVVPQQFYPIFKAIAEVEKP